MESTLFAPLPVTVPIYMAHSLIPLALVMSCEGAGRRLRGGTFMQKTNTWQKNARTEMAQKERKKAFKNIFLAHIQIPVKCFDLVSLYPGGIFWTTDITPSNFYSGTSTNGWGPRAPRRLPPLWMRTPARNMR